MDLYFRVGGLLEEGGSNILPLSSFVGWDGAQRPSSAAAAGALTQDAPDAGRMLGLLTGTTQVSATRRALPTPTTKC